MSSPTNQVMIADDHSLFSDGIEQIINSIDGFIVTLKVPNGKLLLQALNNVTPQLILLDISMPLIDGMETALAVRQKLPSVKIIFISMHYNEKIKAFMTDNKINGFIIKNADSTALKEALQKVMKGDNIIVSPIPNYVEINHPAVPQDTIMLKHSLTPSEMAIIKMIAHGYSSKMIASKKELSLFTVETHRKNIMRKLGAKNVAEVVAFAVENGLHK